MHSHHGHNSAIQTPPGALKIVLAGNPNVGKSVFFNALTGLYVDVSNYPGTTIEISQGRFDGDVVLDTPGVYGVSSFNDEEKIARDVIIDADLVVNIVDAVHLERDLFLTLQLFDMGKPLIVALNMMDEARANGLNINVDALSRALGAPVVPTVAVSGQGIADLKATIKQALETIRNTSGGAAHPLAAGLSAGPEAGAAAGLASDQAESADPTLQTLWDKAPSCATRAEALLILEGDPNIAARHGVDPGEHREEIYLRRRHRVDEIIARVVAQTNRGARLSTILGRLMVQPLTGIPILAAVLWFGMYKLIGGLIAGTVVDTTEGIFMAQYVQPFLQGLVSRFVPLESPIGTILAGEFGVLTMTTTYVLGVILPLVVGFYLLLSAMEDSGYLPRVAALVDRTLSRLGLNGRAVIPLILGFGCVTMATITTRLLGTQRERFIAVTLLGLTIPCSAQLAVIAGLIAPLGPKFLFLYIAIMFAVFVILGTILNKVLPGQSSDLFIDLPPLRLPRISNVLKKTSTKSWMFLKEATPLFFWGALLIGILQVTGLLEIFQNALAPLTSGWLQLPKEASTAFIMGIVRRDFGAAGLNSLAMTPYQTLVSLITITLFVPCIAATLVILKERGKRQGAIVWVGSWIVAFLVGGIVSQVIIR